LAQIYLGLLDDKLTLNDIRSALKVFQKQGQGFGKDQKVQVLTHAYEQTMDRIKGQKPGLEKLAMKVLSWITCAKRPLTTLELQHALATKVGKFELDKGDLPHSRDMIAVCLGLVTIDEESGIVRLVHYTTQEYFEQTWGKWFLNAETEITAICVTYLSFDTFATGSFLTDEQFEARLKLYRLYDYAARNWGHHARATSAVEQLVVDFLKSKTKVSSSGRAMMASRSYSSYSQRMLRQMRGVHLAAYFGLKEAMIALLKNEHDLDSKDTYSQTPLSYAAGNGHEAVVKLLLEKDVDLDSKDSSFGRTPLSHAAGNGHEAVVKRLLDTDGVDPDSKSTGWLREERTPLSFAAENGHEVVVKLLLEKDVDLDAKDTKYGKTPLSWAAEKGHEAVVKLLLEKGADLESKDNYDGQTPLSLAAGNGRETVVKLLLENSVELESKSRRDRTSLWLAAANGHEAVVKLLLEKGAELESKSSSGQTPLSCAAEYGHEKVVKLLLQKSVDTDSKDDYGCTPLSCAAANRHGAVVKLLLENGTRKI
jgi:ankyrin repeat protein